MWNMNKIPTAASWQPGIGTVKQLSLWKPDTTWVRQGNVPPRGYEGVSQYCLPIQQPQMPWYHERLGNTLLIAGNHVLPSGAAVTPPEFIHVNKTATQTTINILKQLLVSVELCSSRAISLNQISSPNEITRFVNGCNWVDLIVLESGEVFNLTALCIPFLNNALFYRKIHCLTVKRIKELAPHDVTVNINSNPVMDCHGTGMGSTSR